MSSVDDIWAEMQAEDASQRAQFKQQLQAGASLPTQLDVAQPKAKRKPKKAASASKRVPASAQAQRKARATDSAPSASAAVAAAAAAPGDTSVADASATHRWARVAPRHQTAAPDLPMQFHSFSDAGELLRAVQRDVNGSASDDQTTRRRSLARLQTVLFRPKLSDSLLQVQWHACSQAYAPVMWLTGCEPQEVFPDLFKTFLRRFEDPVEKCRELAVSCVRAPRRACAFRCALIPSTLSLSRLQMLSFLEVVLDVGQCLPYLFPALSSRLAGPYEYDGDTKLFVRNIEGACAHAHAMRQHAGLTSTRRQSTRRGGAARRWRRRRRTCTPWWSPPKRYAGARPCLHDCAAMRIPPARALALKLSAAPHGRCGCCCIGLCTW